MMSSPLPATLRRVASITTMASTIALSACVIDRPHLVTPDPPPIPDAGTAIPSANHAVLTDGQQVVANTAAGKIKIEAGPGLRRVFDWDGLRRGAVVDARSTPFAGGKTKGISYDGTPKVWADANGITKLRYEEGQRHFENMDDAMIWMQIRRLYYTYNDDGLVVGWRREGHTLHVELWQFYVDGAKPSTMPDSRDSDIARGPLVVEPQKMSAQLVFNDGHSEPYNAESAAKYNNQKAKKQNENCNWFKRLFKQCAPQTAQSDKQPANASAASSKPAKSTTPSQPKATIAGNVVNIRSKPTTKSDVLRQAKQGDSVTILKQEHDWRYVQFDDGSKGWVANFLLKQD